MFCLALFLPEGKNSVIQLAEHFIFHKPLKPHYIVMTKKLLNAAATCLLFLIGLIDFFALTRPGKYILDKTKFIDIKKSDFKSGLKAFHDKIRGKEFQLFSLITGSCILLIAIARAANICITYDEAGTYINYVRTGFITGTLSRQFLNNHILNSLLIRLVCFITQTRYNEFFIRLPNLIFYCVYILFAYRIAKSSPHRYFIFILCVSNYYLNEFFGLARGYGMAAACMLGTFYYFDLLRNDTDNKKVLHKFFLMAALAALSNGIVLYTIFGLLVVTVIKYRINILKLSLCPYFLVFLFSVVFVVIMGRQGRPVASTNNFFESMTLAVFGTFTFHVYTITMGVSVLFLLLMIYTLLKTRFTNDYALIYIIFAFVSLFSNAVFHRGYPISREMIPFYPVVIFIIKDAIQFQKQNRAKRTGLSILGILLFLQFILQIDINYIDEWEDDYLVRREYLEYISRENRGTAAYRQFIDDYNNPAMDFYDQKYEFLLKD
jgi:hypothetical protein